ncbi:winged helix-turn-helix transcriptional regulator [Lentzea tibetensis]|uniref:Winged helix-turn-helix transcriptional regulator n=1 Tax=Lentzea tibetensis TaxID=2591470 RepID=A0A563F175_9PSEU|nr:DUF5937 family protein [Lentzea tibetensis]TWP53710.1 winged helix-turn-helix transcriptional regulator [Lentzea tibetensis]
MALRFSVSPLWETVAALRVLAAPDRSPAHHRWVEWAEPRLDALDVALLHGMVAQPVVPEYLIPTPHKRLVTIDSEITALNRVATPERIRAANDEYSHLLLTDRANTIRTLQRQLRAAHEAIIAPVWSRLEGVLQGDLERRGRRLVEAGGQAVLSEVHADVEALGPVEIRVGGQRVLIGDRDLVLVPSAFIWPHCYLRDSPVRLALCYPAHGFGSLWERHEVEPSLAQLVGATRAKLLHELERPSTVSELAQRVGVTVGAVSQHLAVLRASGLVVSRRDGREVVSLRTALGLALVRGEIR